MATPLSCRGTFVFDGKQCAGSRLRGTINATLFGSMKAKRRGLSGLAQPDPHQQSQKSTEIQPAARPRCRKYKRLRTIRMRVSQRTLINERKCDVDYLVKVSYLSCITLFFC